MDFLRGFDTINHELFITKLGTCGFDTKYLWLIKSYLRNLLQRTKVNTSFISWKKLLLGVPPGSAVWDFSYLILLLTIYFI